MHSWPTYAYLTDLHMQQVFCFTTCPFVKTYNWKVQQIWIWYTPLSLHKLLRQQFFSILIKYQNGFQRLALTLIKHLCHWIWPEFTSTPLKSITMLAECMVRDCMTAMLHCKCSLVISIPIISGRDKNFLLFIQQWIPNVAYGLHMEVFNY